MAEPIIQAKEEKKTGVFIDSALQCLIFVAKFVGVAADERQIKRANIIGNTGMDMATLIRAAQQLGLKARFVDYNQKKEKAVFPLPAIVVLQNGCYVIMLKRDNEKSILYDPYQKKSVAISNETMLKQWTGKTVLIAKHSRLIDKPEKKFGLSWFIPVIMRYKNAFSKVLLFSLVIQAMGLLTPFFTQVIINKVLVHHSVGTLNILVAGMIGICIYEAWLNGFRSYMFNHHISKVDAMLSARLFKHVLALPIKFFEKYRIGDIVSRLSELDKIRGFIVGSAFTTILDSAFALIYLVIMLFYSASLTLITIVTLGCYVLLNLVLTPLFRRSLNKKFRLGTENQSFMIETITGIQTVKTMAAEQHFIKKWDEMLSRYIKSVFTTANIDNFGNNAATLIQQLSMIGILWVGANQVMDKQLTIGELIAFQMYANSVVSPVLRLITLWQNLQETKEALDRLGDIVNEQPEPIFNPDRTTLSTIRGEVVLDSVTFRYRQNTRAILRKINLKIKAGTRIGIVGTSGSGKSTLTKIIQRLYVPETGSVLIDGVDLAQVEPAWLRRQVGVVLQENYLFNGTISDNIAIAKQEASMEEILKVACIAGVDQFVAQLPNGYNTIVGERGTALSGGQKQRIAIARAILTDPKILIFDEATSALDYESENIIKNNLGQMTAGRTMIMIAHRLSTIQDCDNIVVMNGGEIVEQGNHEELLAQQGEYYQLYMLQERARKAV